MGAPRKLFKRGDTWYADLRSLGLGKPSLHTSDLQVAKAKLRDAELGTTGEGPTEYKALAVAIDEMLAFKKPVTAKAYREYANQIFKYIPPESNVYGLTDVDVAAYMTGRLKEVARHTLSKELTVLRQALKKAKASTEVIPEWNAQYEPKTRWLTPDEFARLLGAVKPERRPWLMIQAYTGAELGVLKRFAAQPRGGWEYVDLERGKITLPGTKRSSRFRVDIPLHPELAKFLRKLDHDAPLIAPWTKVHKQLKEACVKAGLVPPPTTHDLRRTFGSWLVQAGVDLHHVARLMGNTYHMVAKVYGQTSDASYTAAIANLPKLKRLRPPKATP